MRVNRRDFLLGVAGAGLCTLAPIGVFAGDTVQRMGGPAFGSSWRAALPFSADVGPIGAAIDAVISAVDATMSPYRPGSHLSRFNLIQSADWLELPHAVADTLREGLRIAALSHGAFDPTVGPLVHRFGFGPIRGGASGGYDGIELRGAAARKSDPKLTLDLCGIAKGQALDQMVAALDRLAVDDFLIELGGEIRARGRHPDGRPWSVAIERPGTGPFVAQRILRITNMALATSGHSGNGYRAGGPKLSHIIDPRTQRPVDNGVASVSVLAPVAQTADALATALLVLGAEEGAALAESKGISALFLVEDGDNLREVVTGRFGDYIIA